MKKDESVENLSNHIKFKEINKNNNEQNNIETFKVYIRIKPYQKETNKLINSINTSLNKVNNIISKSLTKDYSNINSQENEKIQICKVENNILYLEDVKNHKNKTFLFDNIFNDSSNNQNIFNESIKPIIDKILKGYNSTTLAYGATGTGKTYTIFGDLTSNNEDEGIIFKACDYLFEKIEINKNDENKNDIETNCLIKISYFEIYNEIVKDLISENSSPILLVEDPQKGVICQNSKEIIINDSIELKKIIIESNKRRTMASTNQNQFSSRSHAILQISLEKKITKLNSENDFEFYNSKFLIVDLAGSERGAEKGKRREEGVNINKSLFTLSNCLNILSERANTGKFIPYRDSKLTRLLKDSLGGNIITVMIACISSLSCNYDETLSTLNYAFKAKKITKKVMKNIKEINFNNLQYKEMIDSLKNEIIQLKNIIKNQEIKLKKQVFLNKEKEENNNIEILNKENNLEIKEIEKDINNKNNFMNENNALHMEKEINIDVYNNNIEEISFGNLNINKLKNEIESIKKDKNILENYFLNENNKDENIINKYDSIKSIYNKYIEIINEKLVENIEQNMIYNFNIKEITDLNQINNDKIVELEKKDKDEKVIEEINYTKKTIEENNIQKTQIVESIKKNNEQKKELQKLLLDLLDNKSDSMNQYIHILKEKDKLFKITKQYEKEIENYVKMQKQKDEDINKINRKIEILRAKLKEKDKKINELEKKGSKKLEIKNKNKKRSYKNYMNNMKRNDSKRSNKIISPSNKVLRKTINPKKMSFSYIIKEKIISNSNNNFNTNQNYNYITKRLSTIPCKDKEKIHKKINNIIYKTDNNDENINISNFNDVFELKKYKDLTIPKTTITLGEINHPKKLNNIVFIKSNKFKNEIKLKKPSIKQENKNTKKKYSSIIQKNKNNSELIINKKFQLIKSVTVDLKRINYSPETEIKTNEISKPYKSNKNDNIYKSNKSNEKNKLIIKPFKPEKLSIDLNDIQNQNIKNQNDLIEKINNIKLSKSKNNIDKTQMQKTIRKSTNNNIKNIKLSKSNPKLIIENKSNKVFIKKLSLKEARLENKLKTEKILNKKNELNVAESFINEYKKMKSKKSVNSFKNNNNNSNTLLIYENKKIEENDDKSCITDINILKTDNNN